MRVKRINKTIMIEQKITLDQKSKKISPKVIPKVDLKNIIEVTQQNETNSVSTFSSQIKQSPKQLCAADIRPSCIHRYINFITNLCRFMFKKSPKLQIDMSDTDLSSIIQKIKSKKQHYSPLLPPQKIHKKVLVLDLDETLIHTTFTKPDKFDFQTQIIFNGKNTKIYTIKRFGLDSFLFQMSKLYQLIIFTASQRLYADRIIDMIDPKKRISHRLYRQHCFIINKTYFLKNISTIGRKIKDIIIVDDNNIAGLLQPQNFYKIESFEGSTKDRQLCRLSAFLKYIHQKQTYQSIKQEQRLFEDMEINLTQSDKSSMKSSINEGHARIYNKKSYKDHKRRNSQIDNLVTKNTEEDNQGQISASDFIKKS